MCGGRECCAQRARCEIRASSNDVYIARYVPPMMARVTHDGNIVPNSQRYLRFSLLKIAEGNPRDMSVDFVVTVDVLVS